MKLTRISILAALAISLASCGNKGDKADMDSYIDNLMSQMTLEEKIGQLNLPPAGDIVTGAPQDSPIGDMASKGQIGGTFNIKGAEKIKALQELAVEKSRMHIPLIVGMDVIHGYETVFPIPLALASSWDMEAIEKSASIAANEATAGGINWTFSPMVDIARDPRWGRVAEGAGEDPYLGSQIAQAMVKGYQGDFSDENVLACIKHFALYGGAEAGRDYNTVDMSRQRMYNEYLPPYKAAVDAGAATLMTSFNIIDGVPATANEWLLQDLLRDQWGFDNLVVTDYASINEMANHGMGNTLENSVRALKAGTDMDMSSNAFVSVLSEALDKGLISEADIDKACRRVLEAKYRLGLFENPYRFNNVEREKTDVYTDEHRAAAREIAAKTFVLLKNDNNTLPIKPQGTIAVIGPLGNTSNNMVGTWSVANPGDKAKTLYEGIKEAAGDKANVVYAKGSNLYADPFVEDAAANGYGGGMRDSRSEDELLAEALRVARGADVILAAVGESVGMSGEGSSRSNLDLPDTQLRLLKALVATSKPVVMLNFAGRPTTMEWEAANIPAIMNVWHGGTEAADAIADVVFGKVSPSGKLTMSIPQNVGQIPVYYNHLNTGRPVPEGTPHFHPFSSNYLDVRNEPRYPFGYGMTYTTFDYSDFALDNNKLSKDGKITASVKVTNKGNVAADEIVQFYTRDMAASLARPVKELKHFDRISLAPGESKVVEFEITPDKLGFYNANGEYLIEPGEFKVMAGPNSRDVQTLDFTLE
ncbi:MAG: beta-glucosidase BglX [Muribaculaceae bacterium]|nr:beta-glucosidase BglX [Muribaculaceae bacterium]